MYRQRRIAVRQYWKKKTSDLKENPGTFFETFKPFLGSKKGVLGTDINLKVDGKTISSQETVAEILAGHFATIASDIGDVNLRNSSENDLNNHPSVLQIQMASISEPMIESYPFNQAQVRKALESLNTRKASGYDNMPARVLKYGAEKLAIPLANLYNSCITNRQWPNNWERGEWTPVFKKEDPQDCRNYRPITVLPVVSKVFQQLLSDQISKQFDSRLDPRITAYRKRHSCETTLISLIEAWKSARDNQQIVKILSTDLSKAFDSLHPSLMISKLKAYGFNDELCDLLRSYLCNRLNRVKLGAFRSEWKRTDRGCPQGSALGPLLWNIFQNDLTYVITSHLSIYADDHQMFETPGNLKMADTNLMRNANRASEWYASNLLQGNQSKYQTMTLKHNKTESNTPLYFQGNTIESSDCLKLLGITIDEQLNFNTHINEICKKASQRVGVMLRLKKLVPTNAKLTLYKSAILPYLTYCHLTWHFCSATDKRKLERVQERALRAVFLDKQSSYQALLDKSDLTTLQNRRLQDIAILMYKVKHKLCPIKISELFHAHCSPYNLRTAEFAIPRFRTNKYGKHSLTYLGPKLWNKLLSEIRTLPSLFSFKNCIRKFDLGVMIDDDNCSNCILCNS